MSAYVIALLTVTDPEEYAVYRDMVPATIARFGGRYLARGTDLKVLEGDLEPSRVALLEFESAEQARAWWVSEEYEAAKPYRQRGAISRIILAEGLPLHR